MMYPKKLLCILFVGLLCCALSPSSALGNYGEFSFQCPGAVDGDSVDVSFYILISSSTDVVLSTNLEDRHSINDMSMRFYKMRSLTEGSAATIYYNVVSGTVDDYFLVSCTAPIDSKIQIASSLLGGVFGLCFALAFASRII